MQEHLKLLAETIEEFDKNPLQSMQFLTNATPTTTVINKPPDDIRWRLLCDILFKFGYHITSGNQEMAQEFLDNTLKNISEKYQNNQQFCWRAHEHHFHKDFKEYVNCPQTCLCELGEYLTKLRRHLYAND